MRLTLISSHLGCGGAERIISILANGWSEQGHDVTLVSLYPFDAGTPFFPLHRAIRHRPLGLATGSSGPLEAVAANLGRLRGLRSEIVRSEPQAVISFSGRTNIRVLLASLGLGIPVVICERTDPGHFEMSWQWRLLRGLTYPLADAVCCQTPAALRWLGSLVRGRSYVVPNPVVVPAADRSRTASGLPAGRRLVAMGRLHPVKQFDLLIDVFGGISRSFPDWHLLVLGDGPMRRELAGQIDRLHLGRQVHLLGLVRDPFPILRAGDLFVMTSSREGFPGALCEAMACGMPAVSFDCPSGPACIIRDGVDGVLVPPNDGVSLSVALRRLMTDDAVRERLRARAPEILDRYSLEKFLSAWSRILDDLRLPCCLSPVLDG